MAGDLGGLRVPAASIRFADPELQEAFVRDGFVQVPFLEEEQLEELRALWSVVAPDSLEGIYSNVHDRDLETNHRIDAAITRCIEPAVRQVFTDARLGGSSFLVKGTGPNSASTLHQDWNNVDEDEALSASIWCPLVDVDSWNGALVVIPGSHRLRRSIRSLDTESLYLDFDDVPDPYLRTVAATAGDAVIYAHNLLHGSRPNLTERIRVAVVSGVIPAWAPTIHHRKMPGAPAGTFEVLEVDRDFYFGGLSAMKDGRLPDTALPVGSVYLPDFQLSMADIVGTDDGAPGTTAEGRADR